MKSYHKVCTKHDRCQMGISIYLSFCRTWNHLMVFFSNHVVQSLFFLRSVLYYITIVCLLAFFIFIMDLSVYWRLISQNYLVGYFCNSLPWKDRQLWIWLYRLLYCSCKNTFMCGFIVTGKQDKKGMFKGVISSVVF